MSFVQIIFFCFISLIVHSESVLASEEMLPPEEAFKISAKAITANQLDISWDIAKGYYLYSNHIKIESKTEQIPSLIPIFPVGESKHDEIFGEVIIYRNILHIPVSFEASNQANSIKLEVQYRGCADKGICYPPQKKIFDISLPIATVVSSPNQLELLVKKLPKLNSNISQDELLPPEQAFQFFAVVKDPSTVHVSWLIAKDYYLYREKIKLELINSIGIQLGYFSIPQGTPKQDEAFGKASSPSTRRVHRPSPV